jgi:hypothetical protein
MSYPSGLAVQPDYLRVFLRRRGRGAGLPVSLVLRARRCARYSSRAGIE